MPAKDKVVRIKVDYFPSMTVAMVIENSKIQQTYPEIASMPKGIFSHIVADDKKVMPGDRVEIYRPLTLCPKEKRRVRARQ